MQKAKLYKIAQLASNRELGLLASRTKKLERMPFYKPHRYFASEPAQEIWLQKRNEAKGEMRLDFCKGEIERQLECLAEPLMIGEGEKLEMISIANRRLGRGLQTLEGHTRNMRKAVVGMALSFLGVAGFSAAASFIAAVFTRDYGFELHILRAWGFAGSISGVFFMGLSVLDWNKRRNGAKEKVRNACDGIRRWMDVTVLKADSDWNKKKIAAAQAQEAATEQADWIRSGLSGYTPDDIGKIWKEADDAYRDSHRK